MISTADYVILQGSKQGDNRLFDLGLKLKGGYMGDLTKNFNRADLACHCIVCRGTGPICTAEVISFVQEVRDFVGEPLTVTAAVRCEEHNKAIGGAPDSRHLPNHADAVDIECADSQLRASILLYLITARNNIFIEVCPKHIHFDFRPGGSRRLITGADK